MCTALDACGATYAAKDAGHRLFGSSVRIADPVVPLTPRRVQTAVPFRTGVIQRAASARLLCRIASGAALSSMGPNSGGGKRNKSKATPARARFSNWFPQSKTKSSGKESTGQSREHKKHSVAKSGISASVAGAFDRVSQSLLAAADVFHVSPQVADHVLSLLSRANSCSDAELSTSDSESDDDASVAAAAPVPAQAVAAAAPAHAIGKHAVKLEAGSSSQHQSAFKPQRQGLSDCETCALQLLAAKGFSKEEFVDLGDIVGSDLIDICTAAVMRSCGLDVGPFQQRTPSSILEEELLTLSSIYGDNILVQRSASGSVTVQLTYEGGVAGGATAILAIGTSDTYPSAHCRVAAWFHSPALSRTNCIANCRVALERVSDLCASGSPIIFDVFQTLEEACTSQHLAESEPLGEIQKIYDKYKFAPAKHVIETAAHGLSPANVEACVKPVTEPKHSSDLPAVALGSGSAASLPSDIVQTVRIQYNKALNWADESGFSSLEAPQKAKDRVFALFPQYSATAIATALSGKSSHEVKPSIAFNIQEFDFGVQLQCTKAIMKTTDVTKGKAKSLLAQAQQQIVEDGGKIFASNLEEAKQLWVDLSISVYEEQNLNRRKQQAESYQSRHGSAARTSSIVPAAAPAPVRAPVNTTSGAVGAAVVPAPAPAVKKADISVAQVSKLFSEQQCVDAVRAHSTRLRQQPLAAAKNESELKKERELSQRLSEELRAKQQSDRYRRVLATREQLPAFQQQDKIISDIFKNRVTLVVGDTGCGKTTQIPQVSAYLCTLALIKYPR